MAMATRPSPPRPSAMRCSDATCGGAWKSSALMTGSVMSRPSFMGRAGGGRLAALERAAHVGRDVVERGALAQLQRPDVGDDGPAIAGRNLCRVARHLSESVGDDVEEVAHALVAQARVVERHRALEAAAHHHAVAVAELRMAGRAVDVEAL